jgi:hypothetical protein
MKYLNVISWKPEDAQKVTELFLNWRQPEGIKYLYEPCTILGANKSISILKGKDEALAKTDRYWRHVCTSETYPIMDSAKIAKIKT